MHVIALASQKGGSGKTTLAGHLAIAAERAGAGPVALVDTDPQGSLSEWWNARAAQTPLCACSSTGRLSADLERMRACGMALVIIDTPPAILETVTEVIGHADLILVPVQPSPHDLRAAAVTLELLEQLAKPFLFVLNGVTPHARITQEAIAVLSAAGALAPVLVSHRVGYAASMIDGRTVMEIPGHSGVEEMDSLWEHVSRRLDGSADRLARMTAASDESVAPVAAPRW